MSGFELKTVQICCLICHHCDSALWMDTRELWKVYGAGECIVSCVVSATLGPLEKRKWKNQSRFASPCASLEWTVTKATGVTDSSTLLSTSGYLGNGAHISSQELRESGNMFPILQMRDSRPAVPNVLKSVHQNKWLWWEIQMGGLQRLCSLFSQTLRKTRSPQRNMYLK